MALEPYRPTPDPRYRDELDREIDQKIDTFFHRWNWKFMRFIRRAVIVVFVLWVLVNVIPSAIRFVTTQPLGPAILQLLSVAGYLFVFIGFQFGLMYFFMARTRIYWVKPGETGVSFKDYKGNPEVLEAATRIVTLLKGVKGFKSMGGEVTRGVLLIGPPGTGKSYLAQAISTEAGVPFGYLSAPSLTSVWMGMGNIKVMMLYRKARKLAREYGACILFIDEIDAIGGARSTSMMGGAVGMSPDSSQAGGRANVMMGMGGMGGGSGLLNELLLQMDPPPQETSQIGKLLRWLGMRKKRVEMPPVLTMGATNLAEGLDAALLRPGRFDRKIVVEVPDADGRREIIEYYLGKVKYEPMPIDRMISDTIGYTPVAIKFVINEATIHAHFDGRQAINYWDFTHAREMHDWGLRQPIRGMSYEERRRLAYHEAGHAYAVVKMQRLRKERLSKVTIIRHGGALGFAGWKPEEEVHTRTKEELLARMQIALASRAAEEIFLHIQMSGVISDLQTATSVAASILGYYGMGDSLFSYAAWGGVTQDGRLREAVEHLISQEYSKVKQLIENNKEGVAAIAEALILRNELTDIDVNEILARVEAEHPFADSQKAEDRPFGLVTVRALPEPVGSRRNGHRNGNGKSNGKSPNGLPEEVIVPVIPAPAAEVDRRPISEGTQPHDK